VTVINNGAGYVLRWDPYPPYQITNIAYGLLEVLPNFNKTFQSPSYPNKDDDTPCIVLSEGPDRADSEGGANQGFPHLLHKFTLRVSVIALAESDLVLSRTIHQLADETRAALLNDMTFQAAVEGVVGMDTDVIYPRESDMNLCEIRMLIYVTTRSYWLPKATVDLREMQIARQLSETETAGAPPGTLPQPLLDDVVFPASGTDDYAEVPGNPGTPYDNEDSP